MLIYIFSYSIYTPLFLSNLKNVCSVYVEIGKWEIFFLLFTNYDQPSGSAESLPPSSSLGHCHLGSFLASGPTPCEAGIPPLVQSE